METHITLQIVSSLGPLHLHVSGHGGVLVQVGPVVDVGGHVLGLFSVCESQHVQRGAVFSLGVLVLLLVVEAALEFGGHFGVGHLRVACHSLHANHLPFRHLVILLVLKLQIFE